MEINNYTVGSIDVHSVAVEVIEIKDEAENSEKKISDSAVSVLANPFYLAKGINENLDEVANSDDETYEPSSDSDEESEEDDSDSSEDDVVTPSISIEENDEMSNSTPDKIMRWLTIQLLVELNLQK